jgi:hypothetical protein
VGTGQLLRARGCAATILAAIALATPTHASSLAEELQHASMTGNLANAPVTLLVRTAVRGADFPATATTPSFSYEFNPETGTFERLSLSLGPAFAERAETVGRGRFDIGVVYLFANFKTLDGNSLEGLRLGPETLELKSGAIITQQATFSKFTLASHVASLNATYGLTDRWDVNLLLPIVSTSLDAAGRSTTQIAGNVGGISSQFEVDDSAFGVGDVLLRTKYHVADTSLAKLAVGLTARLPTGRKEDFQGLGDFVLTPLFVASRTLGRHDIHVNLGFDVNTDDPQRDRVRYAVGATLQLTDRIALLMDIIGSSGVAADTFTDQSGHQDEVPRSDDVFAAPSIKFELYGSVVAFVGAIIPLTSNGLQANVLPAGGIEVAL